MCTCTCNAPAHTVHFSKNKIVEEVKTCTVLVRKHFSNVQNFDFQLNLDEQWWVLMDQVCRNILYATYSIPDQTCCPISLGTCLQLRSVPDTSENRARISAWNHLLMGRCPLHIPTDKLLKNFCSELKKIIIHFGLLQAMERLIWKSDFFFFPESYMHVKTRACNGNYFCNLTCRVKVHIWTGVGKTKVNVQL